jgi:hypothetical protein
MGRSIRTISQLQMAPEGLERLDTPLPAPVANEGHHDIIFTPAGHAVKSFDSAGWLEFYN